MPSRTAAASTLKPPPAPAITWRASRSPPRSGSRSTYRSTSTPTLPTRTSLRGRILTLAMLAGTLPEGRTALVARYTTLLAQLELRLRARLKLGDLVPDEDLDGCGPAGA